MRCLLLVSLLVLLVPTVATTAGLNPNARLCMHLVASDAYLYIDDLRPMVLEDIDQDLTLAELAVSSYYGYCVMCAYNIEAISCVEFRVEGWPEGRPAAPGVVWEETEQTNVLGDTDFPWGPIGGIACWGQLGGGCDETGTRVMTRLWWGDDNAGPPATTKIYPFCYFGFVPLDPLKYPVRLDYVKSAYTEGGNPRVYVQDCSPQYREDVIDLEDTYGCIIGGTWPTESDSVVTAVEQTTWSTLKSLYRSK